MLQVHATCSCDFFVPPRVFEPRTRSAVCLKARKFLSFTSYYCCSSHHDRMTWGEKILWIIYTKYPDCLIAVHHKFKFSSFFSALRFFWIGRDIKANGGALNHSREPSSSCYCCFTVASCTKWNITFRSRWVSGVQLFRMRWIPFPCIFPSFFQSSVCSFLYSIPFYIP